MVAIAMYLWIWKGLVFEVFEERMVWVVAVVVAPASAAVDVVVVVVQKKAVVGRSMQVQMPHLQWSFVVADPSSPMPRAVVVVFWLPLLPW